MKEYTSVYRNLKTGAYLVQPFALGPTGKTASGGPILLSADVVDEKIGVSVLAVMEMYRTQKYDPALAIRHDRSQQRKFVGGHAAVSVARLDSGDVVIRPLYHEGGGFVARNDDAISLQQRVLPERLGAVIRDAFSLGPGECRRHRKN